MTTEELALHFRALNLTPVVDRIVQPLGADEFAVAHADRRLDSGGAISA